MTSTPSAPQLRQVARTLLVDLVTAETSAAFRARGIEHVLLKGPSLAQWLYRDGAERPCVDSDLLVAPAQVDDARAALGELGFKRWIDPEDIPHPADRAEGWLRATDRAIVDLHWSLIGTRAEPEAVWASLSRHTETINVGGRQLAALDLPARALHVALHAAQHGARAGKAMEDLRRALLAADLNTWREAAELAHRLNAAESLGEGLRLLPAGRQIARELSLPGPTLEAAVRATTPPPIALGLVYLSAAQGWRAKARFVLRKLFPSRRYMEVCSDLARKGRPGLVAAYLWRPVWLLTHFPAGTRVWLAARRRAARRAPRA